MENLSHQYLTFFFWVVKLYTNDGVRLDGLSKTFAFKLPPDHQTELTMLK